MEAVQRGDEKMMSYWGTKE